MRKYFIWQNKKISEEKWRIFCRWRKMCPTNNFFQIKIFTKINWWSCANLWQKLKNKLPTKKIYYFEYLYKWTNLTQKKESNYVQILGFGKKVSRRNWRGEHSEENLVYRKNKPSIFLFLISYVFQIVFF